ncbi:MAG: hypothetical protein ACOVS5_15390, partial [Oligoflexus sp.]
NKSLDKKESFRLDVSPWKNAKSLKLFSFQSPDRKGTIKKEERSLTLGKPVIIDTQPLSMHLVELRY